MKHVSVPEDDEDCPAQSISLTQNAQSLFEYSALDLDAPSIRLVRVLSDLSSSGHIQLDIRHPSIKSTYSSLSYVWGQKRRGDWIRLGGRLFPVRQNLCAFLESARKKPHVCSKWLWMDALRIDRSKNSERSHQVQQMGHIFSRALKVISWLGADEQIAQFFRESTQPLCLDVVTHLYNPGPGMYEFFKSDYWKSALNYLYGRQRGDRPLAAATGEKKRR